MKKLILLPNLLHEAATFRCEVPQLHALIAESEKGGRLFLKQFKVPTCPIYLLNEHTKNVRELLDLKEEVVGLISDAGLPCLADPGAALVAVARKKGVVIEAIPGPSSVIMALQLSGLSGQTFTFHGYFPRGDLRASVKTLSRGVTHIFIETPYKTGKVFEELLKVLPEEAKLCVAFELTGPDSCVQTKTVREWRGEGVVLQKGRAVFLVLV